MSYKTKASEANFDPWIEWKGSLGPTLASFNGGAFTYRLVTSLGYNVSNWNVNLRWRYLPSVWSAGNMSTMNTIKNNARVDAGGEGLLTAYSPINSAGISSYNMFDLSASWNINDTISLRAGINNLFNKQPVLTGKSPGYPQGSDLSAVCGTDPNCTDPTGYSRPNLSLLGTNTGFYDVMGRRYFIGARVTF
jgi:outer membrane receptor for ferrienterochelin and colicin